jgi:hypothetical protein
MMWISILEAGAGGGWVCVCGEGGTSLALVATGKSWMLFEDGIWDFMVAIFMKAIDIGFEFAIDISFEFWYWKCDKSTSTDNTTYGINPIERRLINV